MSDSGEGRWTSIAAIEEGVPATRGSELFADKVQSAQRLEFGGHVEKAQS